MKKFKVIFTPPSAKPGDICQVVDEFDTEQEASEFIGGLASLDDKHAVAVEQGYYTIDGPCE